MMTEELVPGLTTLLGTENVRQDEPMAVHTSFRTGGPADLLLRTNTLEQLRQTLKIVTEAQIPFFILGRGTNLLVGDGGYHGAVITMVEETLPLRDSLSDIRTEGNVIRAGAGASLAKVAGEARDRGLAGFEFASGIPGSVGGALVMNAGAYDGGMDQVVSSVVLMMPDGGVKKIRREDMKFGYRRSLLKEIPAIALGAELILEKSSPEAVNARMQELNRRRREKQPLEYPSAGSTFKRPEGMFAGQLIMEAGMKGFRIGGAAVSEKHCGFVINQDHATSADICAVIDAVKQRVYENAGVLLEEEVIRIGEF